MPHPHHQVSLIPPNCHNADQEVPQDPGRITLVHRFSVQGSSEATGQRKLLPPMNLRPSTAQQGEGRGFLIVGKQEQEEESLRNAE